MILVDSATAALALGVSARTVRRWVEKGRLENHGDTRRVLVDISPDGCPLECAQLDDQSPEDGSSTHVRG